MKTTLRILTSVLISIYVTGAANAQVYSPRVVVQGQVDTGDLSTMAKGIYEKASAVTARQKAEAIWRFFLTDGRFVAPGFWYHIAGWAYEEPQGEVLDPLKLANSYGFGLCYQIAPLLEAVFEAGGFEDARVWFLTGHTVTEVFYEGAYHHFDSDMLGYTTVGDGDPKVLPVASVWQIAHDGSIILSKLKSPTQVDSKKVDSPWYPADLNEAAIGELASLFTTTNDNWLFAFTRYPQGHSMDFELRPGERLTRYFQPENKRIFYMPFKFDGKVWTEFPTEVSEYQIRTEDGPRSQKDDRWWATGTLEYTPVLSDRAAYYPAELAGMNANLRLPDPSSRDGYLGRQTPGMPAQVVFEMQSAYVLIDAAVSLDAILPEAGQILQAEVSVDGGRNWEEMSSLRGPFRGRWTAEPAAKVRSRHGSLTIVSGQYQYLVRLKLAGPGAADSIRLRDIRIGSHFQVNPRTLPWLEPGTNQLSYHPGPPLTRRIFPLRVDQLRDCAFRTEAVQSIRENGQDILWPDEGKTGEVVFELSSPDGAVLSGFDSGARFLDLRDGLAPDKFTAETRPTRLGRKSATVGASPRASLDWSISPERGYASLWEYDPQLRWRDGIAVDQVLRWPEVDRRIRSLPNGTRKVYVRYRFTGMGMDNPRLAVLAAAPAASQVLEITHEWYADGQLRKHVEHIENPASSLSYRIDTGSSRPVENHAIVLHCLPGRGRP